MVGDTFGRHDPYYYESFVGLTEVVKLLDPESSMISVSFQAGDIAKWDDVVVNLSTGGMRCYQVKHTREQNNINFSDLIKRDSKDTTFIRELFDASVSSGLNAANVSLILFTNRDAGKKKTSRADGEKRPPLLAFWSTLKEQLDTVKCFADFDFPSDQKVGWDEFVACFSGCEESEVVAFLKQMEIRTSEDEQENLESRIKRSLSVVFGASEDVNNALFNSLVAALRRWTTSKWIERHGSVTGEELYIALAVPAKPEEIGIAPPPPTPFFSSRIDFVNDLEKSIVSDDGPQTTFLTGEAGSGKTSCVSYLANRRTEGAFESVINARFFCFEPITPQKPFIDSDASKVTPKELWGTLLTQLRTLLRGRWFECKVPIRNSILTWQQAREHVIRLADFVGQEIGRRFVIAVDGIDHAARAKQAQPKQIRDFFNSIPSPDELKGKAIRLLIAGQPAEYYPEEYPTWLAIENESVEVITLPALSVDDILELFKESKSQLQSDQLQTAANLVFALTKGNTLGVVFAVAESEIKDSFDSWKESLEDRRLSGSLAGYYQSIWQSATANVPGVGSSIACAISMARKLVTPEQLTDAFLSWNKPVGEWRHILQQLKPLLEFVEGGYRVRHNDVRIFLARKFQSFAPEERQRVAGELADYYMTETSDRLSAHQTLFDLLKIANREVECAAVFDTDWVFEAVSVGMEIHELWREGIQAAQQLKAADNWDRVVSVACGLQTLNRISNDADLMPLRLMKTVVEPVLASESRVRPTDHWTTSIFSDVVYDIDKLCDGEEYVRARGLIERWFGGLSPIDVLHRIPVAKEDDGFGWMPNKAGLSDTLKHNFRLLGWLYGKHEVDWEFVSADDLNEDETDALFAFEEGFVDSLTSEPFDPEHLELLFTTQLPTYTSNLELATRNLADLQQWDLAGRLLDVLVDDEASNRFVGDACFFALKSNPKSKAHWLTPVSGQTIEPVSISLDGIDNFNQDDMSSLSKMCAAFGWVNDSRSPIQLMSQVFSRFDETELKHPRELQQIILASVCFGRLEHCATAKGNESAIPAVEIGKILKLLLTTSWYSGSYILASTLADQIAQHCLKLGGDHEEAAVAIAVDLAKTFRLGPRMKTVWALAKRASDPTILQRWIEHYIGNDGVLWRQDNGSARETLDDLEPYALEIGLDEMVSVARSRVEWLLLSYRDRKEYSFDEVAKWLELAIVHAPETWSDQGWKLWQLCENCRLNYSGNSFQSTIYRSALAAAMSIDSGHWWQLVKTTFDQVDTDAWHWWMRDWIVETVSVLEAVDEFNFSEDQAANLWGLALAFSRWFESTDNLFLEQTGNAVLPILSERRQELVREKLQTIYTLDEEGEFADPEKGTPFHLLMASPPRTSQESWSAVEAAVEKMAADEYRASRHITLLEIARERAWVAGTQSLTRGLDTQIQMHSRWAFGLEPRWNELPTHDPVEPIEITTNLLNILLKSLSNETVGGALEGMGHLVDLVPEAIETLFNDLDEGWPRRWLFKLLQVWAVSHETEVDALSEKLNEVLNSDTGLYERLQAWVVLT